MSLNIDVLIRKRLVNVMETVKFTADQKQACHKDMNTIVNEKFRYRDSLQNNENTNRIFEEKWNFNESTMPDIIEKNLSEIFKKPVYVDHCNLLIAYIRYERLTPIVFPGIGHDELIYHP